MPITQDRMIALINAGRDYKQAYEITVSSLNTHFSAAMNEEETWAQAFEAVRSHTKPAVLIQNLNSAAVLEVEHAHFHTFRNRNNNKKAKALRKRRDKLAGIMSQPEASPTQRPTQTTAPQYAIRPEETTHKRNPVPDQIPSLPNTDNQQVQADSELDLTSLEPESQDAVNKFIQQLEDKEKFLNKG